MAWTQDEPSLETRTLDPRIPKKHQHVRQPNRDFDRLYWQAKEAQLGSQHAPTMRFKTKSAKGIVVQKKCRGFSLTTA